MNTLFKTVTSSNNLALEITSKDEILNFDANIVESQSIHISDLELKMMIGVNDTEKKSPQRVIVNAEIEIFPNINWQNDDINSVVSYVDIIELIKKESNGSHIELVETFAHKIIDVCFNHSNAIKSVMIKLDKPDVISDVKSVGCCIKKTKA